QIAELLGIDSQVKTERTYRLHQMMEWAVHLLVSRAAGVSLAPEAPARYNTVRYDPLPEPRLWIGSYWLDTTTGTRSADSSHYLFSSRLIDAQAPGNDAWALLLRCSAIQAKLRPLDRKRSGEVLLKRTIACPEPGALQVIIYQVQRFSSN